MDIKSKVWTKKVTRMTARTSGRRVSRKIDQLLKNYTVKTPQLVTHKGFN